MAKKKSTKKVSKKARSKLVIEKRSTKKKAVTTNNSSFKVKAWLVSSIKYWLIRLVIFCAVGLFAYTAYLDIKIRGKFEGQKWALPAHVYTRPMELYIGQVIDGELLQDELAELGYQIKSVADKVGTYSYTNSRIEIYQRQFRFWDGLRDAQLASLRLTNGRIDSISVNSNDTEIIRLEPRLFGSVSPLSHEDRALLTLDEVPQDLINALISIEDRQFYSHFGINPSGILRALFRNVSAGRVVQGGSTLTQQLVKNYYLTSERTIKRKFNEVIMSVLLEIHYSKDEILQAYLNEVHLSQAGNRAIHGFALGSQYFFGRPLAELALPDLALLAGIIKGPSYYNPIRHPERAAKRRNLVLKTMLEEQAITEQAYTEAIVADVNTSANAKQAAPLSYPAFMGFVRENLKDEYQQEDLLNNGLQIFTTLDPRVQKTLEQAVRVELALIERNRGIEAGTLQVAAAVIRTDNGEIAAMVGDRESGFSGFNRAVNARRPVGSLLKPFVYLTALEQVEDYSLATAINDEAITVAQVGSQDWRPQNYDGEQHGKVMLIDALARSYNLATVQLGMELGVSNVVDTLHRVGYADDLSALPSLLLGAVPMSVVDVSQLYLTLASGGFKTPIKAIRSVLSNDNEPLARYSLSIEQVIEPQVTHLINYALQDVVRNGTGHSVLNGFQYDYGLAGKTGTTDDYRDSWFAGYSGNYLTVVWVGRDDNKSTGLTGASGAAKVWSKAMREIPLQRLDIGYQEQIVSETVYYSVDRERQDCSLTRQLPVLMASLPLQNSVCAGSVDWGMQMDTSDEEKHFEVKPSAAEQEPAKRQSFWQRLFKKN